MPNTAGAKGEPIRPRTPLVVLAWTFGLLILVHTVRYGGYWLAALLSGAGYASVIRGETSSPLTHLGEGITVAVVGIPVTFLVARYLWRRSWNWMRFGFDGRLLAFGLLLGLGAVVVSLVTVGFFSELRIVAGPGRFTRRELVSLFVGSAGWVFFTAVLEEFIFRGAAVREWGFRWGWPPAILLGGLYFGSLHLLGLMSELSVGGAAQIILAGSVANLLFTALYLRARSLWLPIGFHAGWNFSLATLFGATMSGNEPPFGLYVTEVSDAGWVTGGTFGIEGSVIVMAVYLLVSLLVLFWGRPRLLESHHPRGSKASGLVSAAAEE